MDEEIQGNPNKKPLHIHKEIVIPEQMPKVYAIGAAGGFTPYDFRLLFFDAGRNAPEGRVEVALSPLAARELRDWLDNLIRDFEKNIRKIEAPEKSEKPKRKLFEKRPDSAEESNSSGAVSSLRMFG